MTEPVYQRVSRRALRYAPYGRYSGQAGDGNVFLVPTTFVRDLIVHLLDGVRLHNFVTVHSCAVNSKSRKRCP